jgi:uncharacterized protein YlxW (UPF0749 family)
MSPTSSVQRDPAASMALLRELVNDDAAQEYAEASRRHRGDGTHDAEGSRRGRWVLLVTCTLLSGLLVLAFTQDRAAAPQREQARQQLVDRVERAQADVAALEADVAATRAELAQAQEVLLTQSDEGAALSARIGALELASGYTAVVGDGVVVVLDDGAGVDRSSADDPGRVLDRDIQTAVNGLWQAGAEAIAINGVRLTATSAIRSAGRAVLVDFQPLVPPYRIEAIGDPETIGARFAATASSGQLLLLADQYGIQVATEPVTGVALPASTALLPVRARVPGPAAATVDGAGR